MDTRVSGVERWLTLNGVPLDFGPSAENRDAEAVEYKDNQFRVTGSAPDHLRLLIDDEELETEIYGRWLWRPRGFAGLYRLTVKVNDRLAAATRVRVLPSKLSYERYTQMLKEIGKFSVDLLFRLRSPADEYMQPEYDGTRSSALREYALLRQVFPELRNVIAAIRRSPRTALQTRHEEHLLYQALEIGDGAIPVMGNVLRVPSKVQSSHFRFTELPETWLVERRLLTYDISENRLLKHFLGRQLVPRIYGIRSQAKNELERRRLERDIKRRRNWEDDESEHIDELERVVGKCGEMLNETQAWLDAPFLQSVGNQLSTLAPTQVLQKHPHYARFYRIYLQLQQSLRYSVNTESFIAALSLRNMAELYETWSVFKMSGLVRDILLNAGYHLSSAIGFFRLVDDQLQLEVNRNAAIELVRDKNRVVIRYEPLYPPGNTAGSGLVSANARSQRTPDMAVELWSSSSAKQVLIFDAKYRTTKVRNQESYVEDDLDKMDQYRRTIQWKPSDPRDSMKKVVASAYIMYPGDEMEHDDVRCDIGALPLKPLMTDARELARAVLKLLHNAKIL
jgi:hypothetical protein